MVWRGRTMIPGFPILLLLLGCVAGCGEEPAPAPTPKTAAEVCADLQVAVQEFYDLTSPNSTLTVLDVTELPEFNGFRIPRPDCAFELHPDPAVTAGNPVTIENFYLDYDETLTVTLPEDLEAAGFTKTDPEFTSWTVSDDGAYYSASMLVFHAGDSHDYSVAADGRVLNLSIGRN